MANITYIKIEDKVYGLHDENALTSNSNLDASKVVGTLPANTYVDTTYENKAAVEGGTEVSLVTTGDKYRWNNASGGGSDIFIATPDVTTSTRLIEAINNNKQIIVRRTSNGFATVVNTRIYNGYCYLDAIQVSAMSTDGVMYSIDPTGIWTETVVCGQERLTSGTNIKTINNTSLLGADNISVLDADSTLSAAKLTGAITNGVTATTQSSGDNSTKIATTAYVDGAISNLPEPMIFKGSLGTGGTITTLPTAASTNKGFTYKVITDGTYASQAAKAGDTFISDGTAWVLIPSGDEPSGTVTSIATGSGLTGGLITSSGTISLDTAFGDIVNPYGSKTANYILAAPNGEAGVPTFRVLVAADLPNGNWLNGSATGSVRTSSSATESNSYTIGSYAVAEGNKSKASGYASHAEGDYLSVDGTPYYTTASGRGSHAEGRGTIASGDGSHTEGFVTTASGEDSHAEGYYTVASGKFSHTQNNSTIAQCKSQTAIGEYNIADTTGSTTTRGDYVFIIGNGTGINARSNAFAVTWDGNIHAQGMAGMIQMFAGATAPSGWLICDGSILNIDDYPTLFSVIGNTYGGDGVTTFALPDMRDRFPIGAGSTYSRGGIGGYASHTHTTGDFTLETKHIPAHTHGNKSLTGHIASTVVAQSTAGSSGIASVTSGGTGQYTGTNSQSRNYARWDLDASHEHTSVGGGEKHNHGATGSAPNIPPYVAINYIICTGKTS